MTKDQEERLVTAWEGIAKGLGDLNESARSIIAKQWPAVREPREAILSKLPSAEEKAQQRTGNTIGPVDEWLREFDDQEDEVGPREKEWLARSQKTSQASGSGSAGSR